MRPWAQWTVKAALVAAGFTATIAGLPGVALAAAGDGNPSGSVSVLNSNQIGLPVSIPATLCGLAGALLGAVGAGCNGGATSTSNPETAGSSAASPAAASPSSAGTASARASSGGNTTGGVQVGSGNQLSAPVSVPANTCGSAVAVLGDSTAGCAGGASASVTSTAGAVGSVVSGVLAPVKPALGPAGHRGGPQGYSSITSTLPGGGASSPAASQLAGIGVLPGLVDLPSAAGPATTPAQNGDTGGGVPMPATALSAANAPPMSSNSFAALAVGALLAGASALKIAGRRRRDRRKGLE
jgi:hypothetical protein